MAKKIDPRIALADNDPWETAAPEVVPEAAPEFVVPNRSFLAFVHAYPTYQSFDFDLTEDRLAAIDALDRHAKKQRGGKTLALFMRPGRGKSFLLHMFALWQAVQSDASTALYLILTPNKAEARFKAGLLTAGLTSGEMPDMVAPTDVDVVGLSVAQTTQGYAPTLLLADDVGSIPVPEAERARITGWLMEAFTKRTVQGTTLSVMAATPQSGLVPEMHVVNEHPDKFVVVDLMRTGE